MKILMLVSNQDLKDNLNEFVTIRDYKPYFASDLRSAVEILNSTSIDQVIIYLNNFKWIELIKYIRNNFPHVKIIVSADQQTAEVISVIRETDFSLFREPFRFSELKNIMKKKSHNL